MADGQARTSDPQTAGAARIVSVARGVALWLLLLFTILGSSWLIQRYFGEDILRVYTRLPDRLEAIDVLLAQGAPDHIRQAVHTVRGILQEPDGRLIEPINADALLQLEQAWAAALDGSATKAAIRDLLLKVQERLEQIVKSDAKNAEARFLLARLCRYSPPTSADYARIEPLLSEARALAEGRTDGESAFLLARILLTQSAADAASNARAFDLIRRSGRREGELRLRLASRVALDVLIRRARQAFDLGLHGDADSLSRTVLAEDPTNAAARLIRAEVALVRRPDSDTAPATDDDIISDLKRAIAGEGAPPRAEVLVAALEAMAGPEGREHARGHYQKALKAGFDLKAEATALFFSEQYALVRILLTAEILLGSADTALGAWALFLRAETQVQETGKDKGYLPESVQERLSRAVDRLEKPELGRAQVYLSLFEDDPDKARERYAKGVAAGFDLTAEIERFGRLKPYGVVRRLLEAATRNEAGLKGEAGPDSEVWYQLGRAVALGVSLFDPNVERLYRKAVEVGRERKTAGCGKGAFSLARILANDENPARRREARELLELARECGITRMDIATYEGILDRIRSADAQKLDLKKGSRKPESH
jgi:hypothetical protein